MLEAERAVLKSIIEDNNCLHNISHILQVGDFSQPTYNNLYAKAIKLVEEGSVVDLVTLGSDASSWEDVDSTPRNIESYAHMVKDASRKRQLKDIANYINNLLEGNASSEECLREVEKEILTIRDMEVGGSRVRDIKGLSTELMDLIGERRDSEEGFFGDRTGFSDLDRVLGGLQGGETLVLAGRPSMGKSSVATQILLNRAKEGAACLFFSLEMSHHMCGMRMLAQLSGISMNRIKNGSLGEDSWIKLQEAKEELKGMKVWIDDTGAIKVPDIRATCRRINKEAGGEGLGLVIVDYLQLCGGTTRDGRERDVAEASAGLKALAKEFSIPVIILSQLNRSCEGRDDKRPRLSDLRESGAIEQDADGVVMVYRPWVYDNNMEESEVELIVRKNRNGPLGSANLHWDPSSMRVRNG